mmetsp:Transcript_71972/g.156839  ORF Transcript_71972/g.156839 Transcript_71972/m.156839 type:complete len:127 (+) Transcript_71972:199-579(+)
MQKEWDAFRQLFESSRQTSSSSSSPSSSKFETRKKNTASTASCSSPFRRLSILDPATKKLAQRVTQFAAEQAHRKSSMAPAANADINSNNGNNHNSSSSSSLESQSWPSRPLFPQSRTQLQQQQKQ